MTNQPLSGTTILITGSARRVGRLLALSAARAGADIILHHHASPEAARQTTDEIQSLGRQCTVFSEDLSDPLRVPQFIQKVWENHPFSVLVNNASIFAPITMQNTSLSDWQHHLDLNLTAPFLLSQAFASLLPADGSGRIINMLDWRALRPGRDHFPYTISKSALAALTQSLAIELAPRIIVNGLALGAILPPSDGMADEKLLQSVPMRRWAEPGELEQSFLFLLQAPAYITGEILHVDGGRHLI